MRIKIYLVALILVFLLLTVFLNYLVFSHKMIDADTLRDISYDQDIINDKILEYLDMSHEGNYVTGGAIRFNVKDILTLNTGYIKWTVEPYKQEKITSVHQWLDSKYLSNIQSNMEEDRYLIHNNKISLSGSRSLNIKFMKAGKYKITYTSGRYERVSNFTQEGSGMMSIDWFNKRGINYSSRIVKIKDDKLNDETPGDQIDVVYKPSWKLSLVEGEEKY